MATDWFYRAGDTETGPLSSGVLKQLAGQGLVTPQTLVRKGPRGRWVPAAKVKGLFVQPPSPPAERGSHDPVDESQVIEWITDGKKRPPPDPRLRRRTTSSASATGAAPPPPSDAVAVDDFEVLDWLGGSGDGSKKPPPDPRARRGAATDREPPLPDPFHLPFEEAHDERSFEWLAEQAPEFDLSLLNKLFSSDEDDCREGMQIVDKVAEQFPDLWIPWAWSAKFRLQVGKLEDAREVLNRAVRRCRQRTYLYDLLARVAFKDHDPVNMLAWAIRSYIAAQEIGVPLSNHTMFYIAQIAKHQENHALADEFLQRLSKSFEDEDVERLEIAYHTCTKREKRAMSEQLEQLQLRYGSALGV